MSNEPPPPATELPPEAGLQSRIRAALKDIADAAAAKSSRMAIFVPGAEISEAMYEIFSDVPRVPDYDSVVAQAREYSGNVESVSDEIPPDPAIVKVYADETESQSTVILAVADGDRVITVPLDPTVAEELFLNGLAACSVARSRYRFAAPID